METASRVLDGLQLPIVQAPLSGGASTPELAIAACRVGALGFLAAGYLTAEKLAEDISRVRRVFAGPFGVNLFVPDEKSPKAVDLRSYIERIRIEASAVGSEPGEPKWSDDDWQSKLEVGARRAAGGGLLHVRLPGTRGNQ